MVHDSDDTDTASSATDEASVDALQRVLASAKFARAEQCRVFLSYVAHETLGGRGHLLNERSIARLALGRSPEVDTRDDPSVRMLARRVRERLDSYYAVEGQKDPCRVTIPVGQYALSFTTHLPVAERRSARETDGPMIAVARFRSPGRGTASDRLAAGLSESLVHALTRFPGVRVAGPLTSGPTPLGIDAIDTGNRTSARYVLYGMVREEDQVLRVNTRLLETECGTVVWSEQFDIDAAEYRGFGAEDELVARLAAALADHRGVVLSQPQSPSGAVDAPLSRRALGRYYRFVDTLDPAEEVAVAADLREAVRADPNNALLVGAFASVHSIAVLMRGASGAPESVALAEEFGRRALALDPRNAHGHAVLATTALAQGEPAACLEHVAELIDIAPFHPSFLYRAGLLTAGCGRWDDGIVLIQRATKLNPHHPSHQRTMLVIDCLLRGDVAAALAHAQLIRFGPYVWPPLCLAICMNEVGQTEQALEQVEALLAVAPDFFERPVEILGAAPAISPQIVDFLMGHVAKLAELRGVG